MPSLRRHWKDLRNRLFFALRSRAPWRRPLPPGARVPRREVLLQHELGDFLRGFDWATALARWDRETRLRALDVGARNFALAPVLDALLAEEGIAVEIDGVEIDPNRALWNLRTRGDYGRYFASHARQARYHGMDFLAWTEPADLIVLLNPFVTPAPVLAWGLPLSCLRPEAIFAHARRLLRPPLALLVTCHPSETELGLASELAARAGFTAIERRNWKPGPATLQRRPRLGVLWKAAHLTGSLLGA